MRYLLISVLFGAVMSGCVSTPITQNPAQAVTRENRDVVSVATDDRNSEAAFTEVPGAVAMMANPTAILLVPVQANTSVPNASATSVSTAGWRTFADPALAVDVDYPANWSLAVQTAGETFTSPQGTTILLTTGAANGKKNEIRIGNQRCLVRTNRYQLTAEVCVETSPFAYSATFTITVPDGSAQWLTLMTSTRATNVVFEAMFDSVRPSK